MKREPSQAVYFSKELEDFLGQLNAKDKRAKWMSDMKEVLKENKFAGEQIRKSQIPKRYIEKYGVNNLYRYDHPEGYRSCYTIVNRCPVVFDVVPHSEYDRIFGYKTT